MYICCRHCKHTGSHYHEQGWTCNKHNRMVNLNNLESVKEMFNCKDCQLDIDNILRIAKYCNTISFEYVFDEYFEVMNNMGVVIKDSEKWNHGFYKNQGYSFTDVYETHHVTNDHVVGYRLLFDGFPVFYTANKDEIEFIRKGLGLTEEEEL